MRAKDDPGTERFLEYFYKTCVDILFRPFHDIPEFKSLTGKRAPQYSSFMDIEHRADPVLHFSRERTNLYLHLCELLANFAAQHSFRSHFYMLSSNIASRMGSLLSAKDKHLRLGKCLMTFCVSMCSNSVVISAAFRFFRVTLRLKNRNLFTHLIKLDALKPVIDLTLQESRRDNLLSSACQEFFECMRKVRGPSLPL